MSKPFLDRIEKADVKISILQDGSHYPVEETALKQLHENILNFIDENI